MKIHIKIITQNGYLCLHLICLRFIPLKEDNGHSVQKAVETDDEYALIIMRLIVLYHHVIILTMTITVTPLGLLTTGFNLLY